MSRGQAVSGDFDPHTVQIMPSQRVQHVHLLRHGEVEHFGERPVRGHLDAPLSAAGERQHARLVAACVEQLPPPQLLIGSDLSRCAKLGESLAACWGVPFEANAELREQHMGEWEGRTWTELTSADPAAVTAYWDDYVRACPPGGESLQDAARRILSFWAERIAATPAERVVVVTHIGVIRVVLGRALGLPLTEALRLSPPAASHTELLLAEAGAVLNNLGERPWLRGGEGSRRPLSEHPRLALSGSAGTGKTTLGRALAERLRVPFIEEGMRARLESGLRLEQLDLDALRELLIELEEEQVDAERACLDGFVADRSAADFAAFWIHYGYHHDAARSAEWLPRVLARQREYDRVILLPWGVLPLVDDGVRSPRPWLQFLFQALVEKLTREQGPPGQLLEMPALLELEDRLRWVGERIEVPQA